MARLRAARLMATAPIPVNAAMPIVGEVPRTYRGAARNLTPGKAATDVTTPISHKAAETALRKYALGFPDAAEEFPWGERVIKVRGKIFVFLGLMEGTLRVGIKLPTSFEMALTLPYVSPTGYGLGRSGWVTASLSARQKPDIDLFKGWIDQSYRVVAPKKLIAKLDTNRPKVRA
jgi:predicted DNA-binding protein (MmcQ/YjbR family)